MICRWIVRARGERVDGTPLEITSASPAPFAWTSSASACSRRCTCLATLICNVLNLPYTSDQSSSIRLRAFSMRSSRSVVSSGSWRCLFPKIFHITYETLPLSEWRVVLILSFPLSPTPPTPQGYPSGALSASFCCCCGRNVEISWSGVRFFFWKDKGTRREKDTSYRPRGKPVY